MLPQINTISKRKEVEAVFKKGRSRFGFFCGVKVKKGETQHTRFVIVVPAKVIKKATGRNRVKRRISEIARIELPRLQPGWDIFILALPPAKESNYQELQRELTQHFRHLHLYA